MKFTGNNRSIRVVIIVLVVLFALGALGFCSQAEAAEGLSISFGKTSAGSDVCADSMLLAQEIRDRWLGALATHGDSQCRGEKMAANVMASVVRTTHLGRLSVGFGAGVLVHGDIAVGPWTLDLQPEVGPRRTESIQFCANIMLRYRIGKRFVADLVHCSTGGATLHNSGKNWLTFGIRL